MTRTAIKEVKQKTCKACGGKFRPSFNSTQVVCSPKCALDQAPVNEQKARKAIADRKRREIKACKERLKSKASHMKEAQAAFNAWVRLRDAGQPCISCGTTADVQYCAGHYRTTAAAPELRFEPLNVNLQCNRNCNMGKSGNLLGYRPGLLAKIGAEALAWLEGPHEAKRYTIDDLKTIKAEYRAKIKQLKEAAA